LSIYGSVCQFRIYIYIHIHHTLVLVGARRGRQSFLPRSTLKNGPCPFSFLNNIFCEHHNDRGDTLVLMGLVVGVSAFFTTFDSPLKRAEIDAEDVEISGNYMARGGYNKVFF